MGQLVAVRSANIYLSLPHNPYEPCLVALSVQGNETPIPFSCNRVKVQFYVLSWLLF